jgi:hypothetical protein
MIQRIDIDASFLPEYNGGARRMVAVTANRVKMATPAREGLAVS